MGQASRLSIRDDRQDAGPTGNPPNPPTPFLVSGASLVGAQFSRTGILPVRRDLPHRPGTGKMPVLLGIFLIIPSW